MTLREKVLEKLNEKIGEYISGEALSVEFGVSRNAIWKAINLLKIQGHDILSVPSVGYALSQTSEIPSTLSINKALKNKDKYDITVLDTATSTNDILREYAQKGAKEGKIILSLEQTSGKGRQNRNFYSPKGDGLYFSILLRPIMPIADASMITILAASAITEVLEQNYNIDIQIKWVNDLLINGKKFAGILTEGSINMEESVFEYIILGIGINLTTPKNGYPKDIADIANSLFDIPKCDSSQKSKIVADIVEKIFYYYEDITSKHFMATYKNKQYLQGKQIDIYQNDIKTDDGIVIGVDDEGKLIVDNGKIFKVSSGEARVRLKTEN